jgi:hypothetical protein
MQLAERCQIIFCVSFLSGQETKVTRPGNGLRTALHTKLIVDVAEVLLDGGYSHDNALRDFLIGRSHGEESKHF